MRGADVAALIAVMAALSLGLWLAELGGDPRRAAWALEKGAVLDGQVYRLVTAHLVHLSRMHTVLNILGLALVTATIWTILSGRGLIRAVLWSGAAISLGWIALQPAGPAYVGFSGITHGIYAYGALHLLRRGPVWMGWVVLGLLALKLGYEFFVGAVPGAEKEIGGGVALLSHSLGTLGGALGAFGTPQAVRYAILVLTTVASVRHAEPGLATRLGVEPPAATLGQSGPANANGRGKARPFRFG